MAVSSRKDSLFYIQIIHLHSKILFRKVAVQRWLFIWITFFTGPIVMKHIELCPKSTDNKGISTKKTE
ncbi:hypothetical protein CLV62_101536 [Dysgonomonas alginatilytica]|uniref:Uncharacterized protein n=1 Tax=Dysgonomonas alginatilytica TaxID=1605892 RepID=A0A2V3PU76_9BACT|nr:hypothetical protein CLV62_101536 [Dysgonomonas alginatilytica]